MDDWALSTKIWKSFDEDWKLGSIRFLYALSMSYSLSSSAPGYWVYPHPLHRHARTRHQSILAGVALTHSPASRLGNESKEAYAHVNIYKTRLHDAQLGKGRSAGSSNFLQVPLSMIAPLFNPELSITVSALLP